MDLQNAARGRLGRAGASIPSFGGSRGGAPSGGMPSRKEMMANRPGASQKPLGPDDHGSVSGGGLGASRSGRGSGPKVVGGEDGGPPSTSAPSPSGPSPEPGVDAVTPGSVQRRLSSPPSQAAEQAFGQRSEHFNKPNMVGPGRGEMNAPVGNIQNFLQNLMQRQGR